MSGYEIAALAEADIQAIARYTLEQWGTVQAERYAALLSERFDAIAQGIIVPKVFLRSRPDLLYTHCGHHYIFYWRPKDSKKPVILAVLHERMDLMQKLKHRLIL